MILGGYENFCFGSSFLLWSSICDTICPIYRIRTNTSIFWGRIRIWIPPSRFFMSPSQKRLEKGQVRFSWGICKQRRCLDLHDPNSLERSLKWWDTRMTRRRTLLRIVKHSQHRIDICLGTRSMSQWWSLDPDQKSNEQMTRIRAHAMRYLKKIDVRHYHLENLTRTDQIQAPIDTRTYATRTRMST